MSTCRKCGVENTADSNFCRRCGARMVPAESPETTAGFAVGEKEETEGGPIDYSEITGTVIQIRSGGDREGEIIGVEGDVLTIGRSPQSDVFLDDVTVSRHHARIIMEAEGYLIEDLNSLNGTYVNRKRIERHQLFDGDELQVGKFKLSFLQQKTEE
jgi:hypothetical protein